MLAKVLICTIFSCFLMVFYLLVYRPVQSRQITGENEKQMTKIVLISSAFKNGQPMPKLYTADGENISPPLNWVGIPAGTKSLALICSDPDAPAGTWVHWVIYGLSAKMSILEKGGLTASTLPEGAQQGTNSFQKIGYGGPSPPPGKPHRYFFKLYALDNVPIAPPAATADQLQTAMKGHIVQTADLMATYQR